MIFQLSSNFKLCSILLAYRATKFLTNRKQLFSPEEILKVFANFVSQRVGHNAILTLYKLLLLKCLELFVQSQYRATPQTIRPTTHARTDVGNISNLFALVTGNRVDHLHRIRGFSEIYKARNAIGLGTRIRIWYAAKYATVRSVLCRLSYSSLLFTQLFKFRTARRTLLT